MQGNLVCKVCKRSPPDVTFTASGAKAGVCKSCVRERNARYYLEHKEQERVRNKAYRTANKNRLTRTKWEQRLRYKYGIDVSLFNEILKSQGGRCAICGEKAWMPGEGKRRKQTFVVDHDHATGKIRGILCGNCNTALGQFKDSVAVLESAIKYLKEQKHD